jgi:hypothetical protein
MATAVSARVFKNFIGGAALRSLSPFGYFTTGQFPVTRVIST